MRATLSTTYRSLLSHLNRSTASLEKLRLQGATGKKVSKPSDDPSAIRPMLNARGQIRASERYLDTMGSAMDRLKTMDSHLDQIENLMVRAREIAVGAGNGAMSDQDLDTFANQVLQVKEELFAQGNAQVNGKYIFSGYAENVPPFAGAPVAYGGDNGKLEFEIAPGEKVQVNLTGNALFMGDADFDGTTDAGGVNLFQVLDDLEANLRAHDSDAAVAQLDTLEQGAEQVRGLRSQMGNIGDRVESAMLSMEDVNIDMQEVLSRYEDADIVETITNLTQQETAFKAALDITSKVSRLSILDYMR